MKKMNNKGFSLVELIIVIAIMAVLMGVLAPQFIKYVEDSRIQKDESAFGEIANAAQIALSVDNVYQAVSSANGATVTISNGATVSTTVPALTTEIQKAIPDVITISSKKYSGVSPTVTISWESGTGTWKLTNSWTAAAGGAGAGAGAGS
ncbi:MAG: type II secretion system GspH family protein [Butyrivibrio sp.]|nr:type II secretion system GspH family protein [Muribaculum sp.]MCM1552426.1 type II secretion system GspH family protein [Butyrivibrio sp.]